MAALLASLEIQISPPIIVFVARRSDMLTTRGTLYVVAVILRKIVDRYTAVTANNCFIQIQVGS